MAMQIYVDRIEKLRQQMRQAELSLYLLPMNDDHGSEYIAKHFKQIEYYSGFSGSAGTLVVTEEESLLWTDGRYFLQAERELLKSGTVLMKMGRQEVPTVIQYIVTYLKQKDTEAAHRPLRIGFDGSLVCYSYVAAIEKAWEEETDKTKQEEGKLQFVCEQDISARLWDEDDSNPRPALWQKPIWRLEEKYSGRSTEEKLKSLRRQLRGQKQDVLVLSALDEIAWLCNLRGDDIAYNPVFYSYMTIAEQSAVLYLLHAEEEIVDALKDSGISVRKYGQIYEDLAQLHGKKIWLDERTAHVRLVSCLPKSNELKLAATPVYYSKSIKNETEIENEKKAHILDGVAVTKFIYWLKNKVRTGQEQATEISAAEKLEEYRKQGEGYLGQSFAPIMAFGEHGAIVHYEADEESNAAIVNQSFLLSDTGGHYFMGSTDITRTIVMGDLTTEQKRHYTAVLIGNLRLMAITFKQGLKGCHLDVVARQPLYEMGLDYNHGTGHGVGYLLNVHEGPNAIRLKEDKDNVFEPGMITSDEPGLYLEGKYGIRLENLILCVEKYHNEHGRFLGFEPLTFVPFDLEAVEEEMMTEADKKLLDAYHEQVFCRISPYLNDEEKAWLQRETRRLSR